MPVIALTQEMGSLAKDVAEQLARDLQLAKLSKFGHDGAIKSIHESIANGWQGLFEPKPEKQPEFNRNGKPKSISSMDQDLAAADRLIASFEKNTNIGKSWCKISRDQTRAITKLV